MLETATSFGKPAHRKHWTWPNQPNKTLKETEKNCLLTVDFEEISELFVEEETIESFVQNATMKVSFL